MPPTHVNRAESERRLERLQREWDDPPIVESTFDVDPDEFAEATANARDGAAAAIGAPAFEHPNGATAGAVGVFQRTAGSWTLKETLFPPQGEDGDRFAGAVALDGGTLLVGAHGDDTDAGTRAGATYVFERTNGRWSLETTLTMDGEGPDRQFGHAVALEGATGLVGAIGDAGVEGTRAGAAAVLDIDP